MPETKAEQEQEHSTRLERWAQVVRSAQHLNATVVGEHRAAVLRLSQRVQALRRGKHLD